jgi:hypothetical protein
MNKRIKELYTKANAWALHNYPPPVNPFEWEDLRSKKFAELIVLECASLFADDLRTMGDFTERACRRAIKEHFGVEE